MTNENKKLVNLVGLSEILQLPVNWLKIQADSGKIPCLFISKRKMRFNPEAVEQALADLAAKGSDNAR